MSIRDYNKVLNIKDMTTGDIVSVIDLNLEDSVTLTISLSDLLLLTSIKELLKNEHSILINTGYKSV